MVGDPFTVLLTMVVTAYMMYVGSAMMFGTIVRRPPGGASPDLQRIQYSIISVHHYRGIFV